MPLPVLIIAHGQPSDPMPLAAEVAGLAARVQALLPDRRVASATLAEPDAFPAAVGALGREGLAYPLFMAGGWFTRSQLPKKLATAGGQGWRVLEPLGTDPAIHALAVTLAREAGAAGVLLAAHGSGRSEAPSAVARAVAARIAAELGLRAEAAFIDQSPRIAETTGWGEGAVCLPFFAAGGGHVSADIPAQLAEAGFRGHLLPPLGQDARVPAIIAGAVQRDQSSDPVA
jgi:sirohydrochlorin ferrochelatase